MQFISLLGSAVAAGRPPPARRYEEAMSTMNLYVATLPPRRMSCWSQVLQGLVEWQRRSHSHHELMSLSDSFLQDIDVSQITEMRRYTSDYEACKPFWMA
jgi:uncharacterized protein YjiS (DUF1127 family)